MKRNRRMRTIFAGFVLVICSVWGRVAAIEFGYIDEIDVENEVITVADTSYILPPTVIVREYGELESRLSLTNLSVGTPVGLISDYVPEKYGFVVSAVLVVNDDDTWEEIMQRELGN